MLCQICQKKEATVHFTEVSDDNVIKLHLCESCAKSKGIALKSEIDLGNFLSSLAELEVGGTEGDLTCPQCGISLRDFRHEGRLGCGNCYEVFGKSLLPLIRSLHKSERHCGKVPASGRAQPVRSGLKELKESLREAVKKEEYEKAAKLRDLIKQMEAASPRRRPGPSKP